MGGSKRDPELLLQASSLGAMSPVKDHKGMEDKAGSTRHSTKMSLSKQKDSGI